MSTKTCTACEELLPVGEFHRNKNTRDGRLHQCRSCRLGRTGVRRVPADPHKTFRGNLAQRGMSVIDYRLMQLAQLDRCAICGEPETQTYKGKVKRLAVDHDHATGEVRALLCSQCNRGLGMLGDNPERLRAAAAYLEGFN